MSRPICRHCHRVPVNRPRGLCWKDYYTPGIKELYPITSKYARHGVGNGFAASMLAAIPTSTIPGSSGKLAVMEQRAQLRQSLFHHADAGYEGDPRPREFMRRMAATTATGIGL